MTTYIKSLLTDFGENLNPKQLLKEINDDGGIVPNCTYIFNINDDVEITFDADISAGEQTTLDGIITAHVPAEANTIPELYMDPNSSVIQFTDEGSTYKLLGNKSNEIIISKGAQRDYTSIKEAVTANYVDNMIFKIYPGTYIEDNPITLPKGSSLVGVGSASNTFIVAQNADEDLLVVYPGCKIKNFMLMNASGSGSRAIFYDGNLSLTPSYVNTNKCIIRNCNIGIEATHSNAIIVADRCIIMPAGPMPDKGAYIHDGAQFIFLNSRVMGLASPPIPMNYGIYITGVGSLVSLATASIHRCNNGVFLDDNATLDVNLATFLYNDKSLIIGNTNTESIVRGSTLQIKESSTYDFDIQASDAVINLFSCELDEELINNPSGVKINAKIYTNKNDKKYQTMTGDLRIGSVINPASSSFGEGKYNTMLYSVLSNDNLEAGTWVDNTTYAKGDNGNFDLFQGTVAGNCFYIGFSTNIPGIKINITTKTTTIQPKDDLIWEFWDGSSWLEMKCMQTEIIIPNYSIVDSYVSVEKKQDIYFRIKKSSPLVEKSLNGVTKRWIRSRIVNTISSVPQAGYIKLHTNSTEIYKDGMMFHYGDARNVHPLYLSYQNIAASTTTVYDQDFYITDTFAMDKKNNSFPDTVDTIYTFNTYLPFDIDTSFPIKLRFAFVCDDATAGDVQWIVNWKYTTSGDPVYLNIVDAPTTDSDMINVTKTTSIGASQNNKDLRDSIELDIDNVAPIDPNSENLLWIFLQRDATGGNANDTYTGSVNIIQIFAQYVSWRSGGYLENF